MHVFTVLDGMDGKFQNKFCFPVPNQRDDESFSGAWKTFMEHHRFLFVFPEGQVLQEKWSSIFLSELGTRFGF